jgi:Tol biopolymer transport system component/DNA-binding winged helix-turn-helix (wHTH) protein
MSMLLSLQWGGSLAASTRCGPEQHLRGVFAKPRLFTIKRLRMNTGSNPGNADSPPPRFRLGDWLVDAGNHELLAAAGRVRVQPRQMQLLLRLAREPGTVLRREQLLEEVWEGRYVNDEALSRAVAELRQLLADDPRAPRYIETVPKLGYRLIALPQAEAGSMAAANPPPALHSEPAPHPGPAPHAGPVLDARGLPLAEPGVQRRTITTSVVVGIVVVALVALLALTLPAPPGAEQAAADLRGRVDRARPFASEPGFDQSARFSRDGHWVAWSASNAEISSARIWIASRDSQSRRQLSEAEGDAWDLAPVFVDDDSSVIFARYTAGACELREQKLIGRESRRIGSCAPPPATSRIDVSPDNRSIAFVQALPEGRSGLALLDRASGKVTPLTDPGTLAQADHNPRFSFDGSQLVFTRGQHSAQYVWLLPLSAPARARQLIDASGMLYGTAWLPGDNAIVLAGDLFGYRALYRADSGTGALEFLGARGARYPDVAPDGGLLYEVADYQANIWRMDLFDANATPHPITQSQRYNNQPVFAPDGSRIAFASNRDGLEALYLAAPDGSGVERLALDHNLRWVRPSWHPDGRHLLVTAILNRSNDTECLPYACSSERTALYSYDLAARRAAPLAQLGDDARYAQYSADGQSIYYLRHRSDRDQLWRAAADGSGARVTVDANVENFTLDYRYLVVDMAAEAGLRVCDLQGDNCREVLTAAEPGSDAVPENTYMALHNGSLAYVARNAAGQRQLRRLDLASNRSSELLADAPNTFAPALSFSPDGRTLLYARNDRIVIDLFLGEPRSAAAKH